MTGTTRRTSVYTIRLGDPRNMGGTVHGLRRQSIPISDLGEASVSFRAASDRAALEVTRAALSGRQWVDGFTVEHELTTGLGVHRRTVTA